MIHVRFKDGSSALFNPGDIVGICEWLSEDGSYFSGDCEIEAEYLEVGQYIFDEHLGATSLTPITSIRTV
jgi:hypothetical protein